MRLPFKHGFFDMSVYMDGLFSATAKENIKWLNKDWILQDERRNHTHAADYMANKKSLGNLKTVPNIVVNGFHSFYMMGRLSSFSAHTHTHSHQLKFDAHCAAYKMCTDTCGSLSFIYLDFVVVVWATICNLKWTQDCFCARDFCLKCTICYWFDVQWAKCWRFALRTMLCALSLVLILWKIFRFTIKCLPMRLARITTTAHIQAIHMKRIFQMPKYGT